MPCRLSVYISYIMFTAVFGGIYDHSVSPMFPSWLVGWLAGWLSDCHQYDCFHHDQQYDYDYAQHDFYDEDADADVDTAHATSMFLTTTRGSVVRSTSVPTR